MTSYLYVLQSPRSTSHDPFLLSPPTPFFLSLEAPQTASSLSDPASPAKALALKLMDAVNTSETFPILLNEMPASLPPLGLSQLSLLAGLGIASASDSPVSKEPAKDPAAAAESALRLLSQHLKLQLEMEERQRSGRGKRAKRREGERAEGADMSVDDEGEEGQEEEEEELCADQCPDLRFASRTVLIDALATMQSVKAFVMQHFQHTKTPDSVFNVSDLVPFSPVSFLVFHSAPFLFVSVTYTHPRVVLCMTFRTCCFGALCTLFGTSSPAFGVLLACVFVWVLLKMRGGG